MIYKIQSEFDESFSIITEKLSKYFDFIYVNNILYLGLRKYENKQIHKEIMKKILRPSKKYYVVELTEKNLSLESRDVINWCKDKFVELDRQRFEIEQQEKLQAYMMALDKFDEIMSLKAKEQNTEIL